MNDLLAEADVAHLTPDQQQAYHSEVQKLRQKVVDFEKAREARSVAQIKATLQPGYDEALRSLPIAKSALKEAEDSMPQDLGQVLYGFIDASTQTLLSLMQSLRRYRSSLHDLAKQVLEIEVALEVYTHMTYSQATDKAVVEKLQSVLQGVADFESRISAERASLEAQVAQLREIRVG